jgi:drug/metabolite transporter (DMT)-like permease
VPSDRPGRTLPRGLPSPPPTREAGRVTATGVLGAGVVVAAVGLVVTFRGTRWPGRLLGLTVLALGAVVTSAAGAAPTTVERHAGAGVVAVLAAAVTAAGMLTVLRWLARRLDDDPERPDAAPTSLDEGRG